MPKETFLFRSRPIVIQAFFGIILGIIIVVNTASTDHILHDFYVKPTIGHCYPENQDTYCTNMRELHNVPSNAQLELGDVYWKELARQALTIGLILFIIRISFSVLLRISNGARKIRPVDIFVALIWGLTASLIFLGGFLDVSYYFVQNQDVPSQLPWLNDIGLFQYTQGLFGEKDIVEIQDLYATIILSFAIIIFLWIIAMAWWVASPVKKVI